MSTAQIESLWQYIQTLSLSQRNRKWLAAQLLEGCDKDTSPNKTTMNAIKEVKKGQVVEYASLDDFKKRMYEL